MKIFRFVNNIFLLGLTILSNITNALDCVLMKNQECKARPEIISINSNNPIFYPFSVKINRCGGNCNETRHIKWHESCKCICRLDKIICNNKERWNEEKCRCECKELIDNEVCNKGFIWNPSNC